jgi:hypothetical protein
MSTLSLMLTNQYFFFNMCLSELRFSQWWLQRSLTSSCMQHCMTRLYSAIPDESNHDSCTAVTLNTAFESTYSWWYLPKQSRRCITIIRYMQCNVVSSGHIMGSAHSAPLDRFFWCNESWSWTAMWGVCLPVTVQTPTQHMCMCAHTHTHTHVWSGEITGRSSWARYIL